MVFLAKEGWADELTEPAGHVQPVVNN